MRGIDGDIVILSVKCNMVEDQYKTDKQHHESKNQHTPPPAPACWREVGNSPQHRPIVTPVAAPFGMGPSVCVCRGKKHIAAHPKKRDAEAKHIPKKRHRPSG